MATIVGFMMQFWLISDSEFCTVLEHDDLRLPYHPVLLSIEARQPSIISSTKAEKHSLTRRSLRLSCGEGGVVREWKARDIITEQVFDRDAPFHPCDILAGIVLV